jgi:ribonuclease D
MTLRAQRGARALHVDVLACVAGTPLDKRPQLSDWLARPLRPWQRHYAAADAFVLIPLYEQLERMPRAASGADAAGDAATTAAAGAGAGAGSASAADDYSFR